MSARQKPDSCIGCPCHDHGSDFSQIEGTGSSGVLLCGEASGEMEARDGLPFRPYAPAGSVLQRTFQRMGLDRQQFSITNILRCRPRNNWLEGAPWEFGATNHCRPNLDSAIAERRPRCVVALGGAACRELTGMSGTARGVTHLAGYVLPLALSRVPCNYCISYESLSVPPKQRMTDATCDQCHGTGYISGVGQVPVIPNFHPSYLRRGKASHQGVFARILQRAVNIAKGTDRAWMWNVDPADPETWRRLNYVPKPNRADIESYTHYVLGNQNLDVFYDFETNESASLDEDAREGFTDTYIRLVQFYVEGRGAIAIAWEPDNLPFIAAIMQSPNAKAGHNVWLFDNKVARAAGARDGVDINPRGIVHDTLAMFHHWQPDLPAHLQFAASFVQFPFPWKHLAGSHIEFYGCCDVHSDAMLFKMLKSTLQRDGLWGDAQTGYIGQVYEVRPILAAMEDRGMPIDDAARVALGGEFERTQAALGTELSLAAGQVGRVQPKEGYVRVPPEVKAWYAAEANRGRIVSEDVFADGDGDRYRYIQREFDDVADDLTVTHVPRWCRVYDFNPNSRLQVIAYMRAKGHPIPKDKHREDDAGENPDTTAAKELMRLAAKTGDLFYLKVIEYRGMTKLRGTYVDGFAPGPDGCVHTTFTFDTGIGQLSSRNPNIQNFPKLKPTPELAKAMRKMVAARDGKVLTEWDFKSCHIITLGFLAEDLQYMRLGRLDMHSFIAGHFLNLWNGEQIANQESDAELLARFKWLKSDAERKHIRDDQAKHGILGIGNGLKARGLYERYMENFPPRKCPVCGGSGRVAGTRVGGRKCGECKGLGMQSGQRIAEEILAIAERLFPKVFAWQRRIQKVAHEQQYLRTHFGHIRRFYEVFRWDARRHEMGHGDQAEEAIAFWLANIAFGHIREKLKELAAAGLDERYGLFNNVHDSFMFHFDERELDAHVREVYPILVSPSKVLRHPTICPDGLVIDVEGAAGQNWATMTEINVKGVLSETTQQTFA